jgi:hypothetical protein
VLHSILRQASLAIVRERRWRTEPPGYGHPTIAPFTEHRCNVMRNASSRSQYAPGEVNLGNNLRSSQRPAGGRATR